MIQVTIKERCQAKDITTAYQLQKALSISPDVAARLWKGEFEQLSLRTLDRLCRVLKCQPNQLFKYVADNLENEALKSV